MKNRGRWGKVQALLDADAGLDQNRDSGRLAAREAGYGSNGKKSPKGRVVIKYSSHKKMMEETIHKYHDPAYSVDQIQWQFNRTVDRGRFITVSCFTVMAASIAGILLAKGWIATGFGVLFFVAGLAPLVTGLFGRRPACSGCGNKMQRDQKDSTFLVCRECKRFIWTGNRMDGVS